MTTDPACPCGAPMSHAGRDDSDRHSAWLHRWPETDRPEGPVLAAVQADLADIDIGKVKGGRTYRATALWLAGVIDKRGSEDGPSVTAKLADQLTKVMQLLTREGGEGEGDDFRRFSDSISQPVAG